MVNILSNNSREEICTLYKSGHTVTAISNKTKHSRTTISLLLSELRLRHRNKIPKTKITKQIENNIIDNYLSGKSIRDVAKLLGISFPIVLRILNKNKVKRRKTEALYNRWESKQRVPNEFTFNTLSPSKAFLLGLIMGDGSVTKNGFTIGLHEQDIDLTQKINAIFDNRLHVGVRGNMNCIQANSQRLYKELVQNFNIGSNKIDHMEWPSNIPKKYLPHLCSGLIATDGCICYHKDKKTKILTVSFSSISKKLVEGLRTYLAQQIGFDPNKYVYKTKNGGKRQLYTFIVHGTKAVSICKFLYSKTSDETRSSRKFEVYLNSQKLSSSSINNRI